MGDDDLVFLNVPLDDDQRRWVAMVTMVTRLVDDDWFLVGRMTHFETHEDMLRYQYPGPFKSKEDAEAWAAWATMMVGR